MTERTPQSGGRGIRRVQPPTRLTYDALGNPSNYQQVIVGAVGSPQGRVAEVSAGQVPEVTGGQVAGVIGDQVAAFTEGQVAGVIGDQVAAVTKSQAAGASGGQAAVKSSKRAKSVVTNSSSASVRLRQNELEAKKKGQALKETLAAKREELRLADSELFRAKGKLEALTKRNTDGFKEEEIADLEIKIIDLQANFNLLVKQVDALEESTAEKLSIIHEEKELNEEIIVEEESSKNSENQDDRNERVRNWIHDADFVKFDESKVVEAKPADVLQQTNNDMVSQLVSALGQAFGGQQQSTIITKQVDKDLPIFTGKPEDWLIFKSEYDRTSWKYKYDDSENTVRLRKFVKGPAKDSINHLLANPFNATKVMETLERRYGNPQFVLASLIEKAKSVRSPDVNRPETIVDYGTAVDVLVTNIVAFQMSDYLNNIQLLSELVEKLPAVLRRDWYRWIGARQIKENLQSFQTWLSSEVDTAIRSVKPHVEEEKRMEKDKRHHGFNAAKEEAEKCACCNKPNHNINACYTFRRMKIEDRWKIVRDAKLCFQCLEGGHVSSSCSSSKLCGVDDCDKRHHRHLHRRKVDQLLPPDEQTAADGFASHTANMAGNVARPLMFVKVAGPLGTKKVLALLDMGCSFTAIEDDVAKEIGLEVKRAKFTFEVFKGRRETEEKCGETSLKISGLQRKAQSYQLKQVKSMGKLGISGNPLNFEELKSKYPHLRQSNATSIPSQAPQMVIGYDNFRLYNSRRSIEGSHLDHPSAHQCRLGWYICTGGSSAECFYACESCDNESEKQLNEQTKEFSAMKMSAVKTIVPSISKGDARALEMEKKSGKNDFMEAQKMRKTQDMCMLKAQQESFPEEVAAAEVGESFGKSSKLCTFSVGVNEDGLLVSRERIDAAVGVDENTKRPVLLDSKHPYTQLWIQWLHQKSSHHGQERVIADIRKTTWILECRNSVLRCWVTCPSSKLMKLQPLQPEMGKLLICRLGEVKQLFYHTGVNIFGPLSVRVNRSIEKRWGIVFTSMSTRAAYLNLVEFLEAAEVIHAIARFAAARGSSCHNWSDTGTNFVKANKVLKLALKEWDQDNLQRLLAAHGIQWHFDPPAAPHTGGSWERLIACARILMILLKSQAYRESVLRTVLYQAADILNGRSLIYAGTDPDDPEVITPNHLLKMKTIDFPIIPGLFEDNDRFRRSWKHAEFLADEFWRRWTAEYIQTLLNREKSIHSSEPLKEGDVVFLVDDRVPRSSWKKAIVTATFPGKDGVVRVVDLRVSLGDTKKKGKLSYNILRRPVRKVRFAGTEQSRDRKSLGGRKCPSSTEASRKKR